MFATFAAIVALSLPTPAFLPVAGPDGFTCPGGTLANGDVRPGDGFSAAGLVCVAVAVRMLEAG